ncbi:MAG: Tim44-like domain-containing protein, partial [Deltaproteobacteria bacterium]|nr:Tim44-like domain-containing protein [Deltaproteobacteria bacterium]
NNIPDFSEATFTDRVNSVFFAIQHAKITKDLQSVRQYVTEGYFNKFRFALNQISAGNKVYFIKDLSVEKITIVKFKQEDNINSITVRIDARMVEALVDKNDQSKVYSGSKQRPKYSSELWTFVRGENRDLRSDTRTSVKCPVCGAPANQNDKEKCEFCGATMTTQKHENDWLLSDTESDYDSPER